MSQAVLIDCQQVPIPRIAPSPGATDEESSEDLVSLSPSITNYPMRWGRRYHKYKEGQYLLPNDEAEIERLNLQHAIIRTLHGDRLFFSPVTNPQRILDLGTGTGVWPIELADSSKCPNARITGIDLSPIQPEDVPENVIFEVADCTEDDWCRPPDSIDLIHARMLLVSLQSFPDLLQRARSYLKPGSGWLELHELDPRPYSDDDTLPDKWPLKQWDRLMSRGVKKADASNSLHVAPKLKQYMLDAGYVDVREYVTKIPIGPWPKDKLLKECGRAMAQNISSGVAGMSYKILGNEGLGMSREEIEVFLAEVRNCLKDGRRVHAYYHFYTVCGRKPDGGEEIGRRHAR